MRILLIGILPAYDSSYSIGLSTIKAYLLQQKNLAKHIEVKLYLFKTDQTFSLHDRILDVDPVVEQIYQLRPDVVGFSCYTWNLECMLRLSIITKAVMPNVYTVLGGPEASPIAKEIMEANPFVDFVVQGEGECTFAELISHLLAKQPPLNNIKGITYRRGVEIHTNQPRNPIDYLDDIPSIHLSGLVPEMCNSQRIIWETCRGCLYDCHYCYYGGDSKRFIRSFSMERIKNEILFFCETQTDWVTCIDATFNYNSERMHKILEYILSINQVTKFLFSIKIELLDAHSIELLNALANNGFIGELEIGLQSTNIAALKQINRTWNPQSFLYNFSQFSSALKEVSRIDLIYGLPGDSYSGFKESLEYAVGTLTAHRVSAYRLSILPGTQLYIEHQSRDIVFDKHPPHYIYSSSTYSYAELLLSKALVGSLFLLEGHIGQVCNTLARELNISLTDILEQYAAWRNKQGFVFLCGENILDNVKYFITELCIKYKRTDLILPSMKKLLPCRE